MQNLLEAYKNRVKIAESVYSNSHDGAKMDNQRKITLSRCLNNVDKFLTEALDGSAATQRADLGNWKKFCLNLTTVVLPNLIANDLVITQPMSSISGYVTYIEYVAGKTKGSTTQGDVFNSPFALGDVDADYTSEAVTETFATGQTVLGWTPVVKSVFTKTDGTVLGDIKVVSGSDTLYGTFATDSEKTGTLASMTWKDATGASTTHTLAANDKMYYKYDNIVVPQNDLPSIKAEIKSIPLIAKARRITVYYSQLAAFQATTDYGINLGDQLAEKAVGQMSYEIDTEVTNLLVDTADSSTTSAEKTLLTWSKTLPVGVSKRDHYAGFSEIISIGAQLIYDRTKRFQPTYMLCASNILPVLNMMDGFKAASTANINGPFFAGTLNGLKVYVTPNITAGKFCLGVNGSDMMSSVAVYAPYMPIVPTQLLQFNDGLTTQGWATMYDLKVLNDRLIVAGEVTA